MATTSDLTIIKKHILTKAQYEALETIEPNDEYYVIDDDGGSVKYSNEQALTDEQKTTAQKNIGVDILINQKADLHHTHEIADVNGLQDKLDSIEGKIPVPEELDKEIVYVDKYSDLAKLTDKSQDKLYFVYEENSIYSYNGTDFVEVSQPSDVIITDNIDEIPNMLLDDGNYSVIYISKSNEQHNGGELYLESFNNNKVQAIKCIRYFKGLSLKEAKTVIDAYPNGFPYLLATGLSDAMLIKYYQDYALFGVTLSYTLNSTESPVAKIAYNLEKGSDSKGGYTYKLSNAESVATYDPEVKEWVWKYYAYLDDLDNLADTKSDIGHTHAISDVLNLENELTKMKNLIYAAL